MHSTGSMNNWSELPKPSSSFLGWMQSTGQASTQAVSLVPIQGSAMTYAISDFSRGTESSTLIVAQDPTGCANPGRPHYKMREFGAHSLLFPILKVKR